MIDWHQFSRNVLYGVIHRPAQVVRWLGHRFQNEAAPLGAALVEAANEVDGMAYQQLQPYVPTSPGLVAPPPPPPPPPPPTGPIYCLPWVYTPKPALTEEQQIEGYSYGPWIQNWFTEVPDGSIQPCTPPPGAYNPASGGWGPGYWLLQWTPPIPGL